RDSVELRRDHPAILAALGHFDSGQLLARHGPALVGEHRAYVIDAIGVRHEAAVADLFGNLFDRPMQVADVRNRLAHHLAVGPHHEAQHPVRRRMLRAHVERHFFGAQRAHFFFVSSRTIGLSLTVEIPWYSGGSTKSLRSGWPIQSSGIRIRRRSLCPSKLTPSKSNISRSIQFADFHTPSSVATLGLSRGSFTFNTAPCRCLYENRWYTTSTRSL